MRGAAARRLERQKLLQLELLLVELGVQLYYRDGSTPYSRSDLFYRYAAACNGVAAAAFHQLIVRSFGTLSIGGSETQINRVGYTVSGGSLSGSSGWPDPQRA